MGYLWLSSSTTAASSAEEFAGVVFGWHDREVSVDSGESAGPTWVSVTQCGLTIRMLFVPDSRARQRRRARVGTTVMLAMLAMLGGVAFATATSGYVDNGSITFNNGAVGRKCVKADIVDVADN